MTVRDAFIQFSRNGRFGTCVDCPTSGDGTVLPELCRHTDRYDHNLDIDRLADTFKRVGLS